MERLRQIRQQEQNELQIKAEVEKRVQTEVNLNNIKECSSDYVIVDFDPRRTRNNQKTAKN